MATLLPELRAELKGLQQQIEVLELTIEDLKAEKEARERDEILLNNNDDLTCPTMGLPHVFPVA